MPELVVLGHEGRRHARRERDDIVIEKRIANLDTGKCAHTADLAQIVVGEGDFEIEVHHPLKIGVGLGGLEDLTHILQRGAHGDVAEGVVAECNRRPLAVIRIGRFPSVGQGGP